MLITNYAMLEHLLLLPRNAPLFANNALRFIVLDEIHTYYGAQATEVAFLLRKLKTRLGLNQGLQVFGTSASLSSGPDADEQLKSFASRLFGEEVNQIVRGRRIAHTALSRRPSVNFSLSVTQWVGLGEVQRQLLALDPSDQTVDAWNALVDAQDEDLSTTRIDAKGSRCNDLRNQLMLACEGDSENLSKRLRTGKSVERFFRHAHAAFNAWSKLPVTSLQGVS